MELIKVIGRNIRIKKTDLQMSVDDLSLKSGVKVSTLSAILRGGVKDTGISHIVAIAKALECSVDYLINGADNKSLK
jgi:transcriptional regulator with XRE-family HTH domain